MLCEEKCGFGLKGSRILLKKKSIFTKRFCSKTESLNILHKISNSFWRTMHNSGGQQKENSAALTKSAGIFMRNLLTLGQVSSQSARTLLCITFLPAPLFWTAVCFFWPCYSKKPCSISWLISKLRTSLKNKSQSAKISDAGIPLSIVKDRLHW